MNSVSLAVTNPVEDFAEGPLVIGLTVDNHTVHVEEMAWKVSDYSDERWIPVGVRGDEKIALAVREEQDAATAAAG